QSRNGTLLNGQRVISSALKSGDLIVIGAVQMTVIIHAVSPNLAVPQTTPAAPLARAIAPGGKPTGVGGVVAGAVEINPLEQLDDLEIIEAAGAGAKKAEAPIDPKSPDAPFRLLRRAADAMPSRHYDVEDIILVNP